jgi:Uma2 family endonuclease
MLAAGVRLAWEIDPRARTVAIYVSPEPPAAVLTAADTLDGGAVLPGFALPLANLFAELDRQG